MPICGTRKTADRGINYARRPEAGYAKTVAEAAKSILEETSLDIFGQAPRAFADDTVVSEIKDFVKKGAVLEDDYAMYPTAEDVEDAYNMIDEQVENNVEAIREYASVGGYNPVIGMSPFVMKNILIDTVFDKGVIPKFVARSPKFTVNMETRIMRNALGDEIDMWLEQQKIFDMMESTAPLKDTIIKLPEVFGTTDVLKDTFHASGLDDNLSIESSITSILVDAYVKAGETYYDEATGEDKIADADGTKAVWYQIPPKFFVPAYGTYDRQLMDQFGVSVQKDATSTELVSGTFMGYTQKNKFDIRCTNEAVKAIKLTTRIDTSTAMIRTCTVDWKVRTDIVEIPNAIPINTPISPEEVKDLAALYQVNQLTKLMGMFKLVLANYKDEKIHRFLDKSYMTMPDSNKFASTFNAVPKQGYFSDPIDWRSTMFMDQLELFVDPMFQVLNDPNMTVTIVGRNSLIRRFAPKDPDSYNSPSETGGVMMEWKKTIVSPDDRRIYQFIGTDKMRDNNSLIVILNPRNSERIVYRLYDYQMYVSNEIRNAANWALPAIHAFERFKCMAYQPIQGRYRILNPGGLSEYTENEDPIGTNRLMDYTANIPDAVRKNYPVPKDATHRTTNVDPNTFLY